MKGVLVSDNPRLAHFPHHHCRRFALASTLDMLPFSIQQETTGPSNDRLPLRGGSRTSGMRNFYSLYQRCCHIIMTRYSTTLFGFTALGILYMTYLGTATPSKSMDDLYKARPFCNATGFCGERADIPSPRTVYSARTSEQYRLWYEFSETLRKETESSRDSLIFLGDSITEAYRGTAYGTPCQRCRGIPNVHKSTFGESLILGISGDQTQHLLYRLAHNSFEGRPLTFVVLIGTNNLSVGISPEETSMGILAVVEHLMELKNINRIILLHVLPRSDDFRLKEICPPSCQSNDMPLESFIPLIHETNAYLENQDLPNVDLLDCNGYFFQDDTKTSLKEELFFDHLHPNVAGSKLLSQCIRDCLDYKTCTKH